MAKSKDVRVHVKAVGERDGQHYVVLGTRSRWLPIFTTPAGAHAIGVVAKPDEYEQPVTEDGSVRPLTADLVLSVADLAGLGVQKLMVTEVRDRTFYGELHLSRNGGPTVLDCRPSDGIAVALRAGAPMYASDDVLRQASMPATACERWLNEPASSDDTPE